MQFHHIANFFTVSKVQVHHYLSLAHAHSDIKRSFVTSDQILSSHLYKHKSIINAEWVTLVQKYIIWDMIWDYLSDACTKIYNLRCDLRYICLTLVQKYIIWDMIWGYICLSVCLSVSVSVSLPSQNSFGKLIIGHVIYIKIDFVFIEQSSRVDFKIKKMVLWEIDCWYISFNFLNVNTLLRINNQF